jgi:hypothetical protein
MPVTLPDVSNAEAKRILQVQDKIIKSVPEVTKASISDSVKLWHQEVGISDETREKHRQRMLGTKHSYESIVKQKQKALNRKRYECPICYKTNLDGGNFNQHMQRIHEWERSACEDFKVK